jgi:hypothetical protein
VIAHDAVLLWPDGPERASKSTKKLLNAIRTRCAASRAALRV